MEGRFLGSGFWTFSGGLDDLREDVVGHVVSVLHGTLAVLDPLGAGGSQQEARRPHLPDEGSVLWVELER